MYVNTGVYTSSPILLATIVRGYNSQFRPTLAPWGTCPQSYLSPQELYADIYDINGICTITFTIPSEYKQSVLVVKQAQANQFESVY